MQCSFSFVIAVVIAQRLEKMSTPILSPTNCEIRAVLRFMHIQKQSPAEIYRQLCQVYRHDIMSDSMVRRWCGQFTEGQTNVHDIDRSGRASLVTPGLLESVQQAVLQNRRFTISELSGQFPEISRSLPYEIVFAGDRISEAIFSSRCAITTAVTRLKLHCIIPTCSLSTAMLSNFCQNSHTICGRDWNLLSG